MAIQARANGGMVPTGGTPGAAGAAPAQMRDDIHKIVGPRDAPILVVCDALMEFDRRAMEAWHAGLPATEDAMRLMVQTAERQGVSRNQIAFVRLAPPMSQIATTSQKRKWDHIEPHVANLREVVKRHNPRMVITTGELASRALLGRSVKITKDRGKIEQAKDMPVGVMPMFGPGFVMKVPEHMPVFAADWLTVSKMVGNNFTTENMVKLDTDYRWVSNLDELMGANRPRVMAIDTETTGLNWYEDHVFPFLVQITVKAGQSLLLPIHERYWVKVFPDLPVEHMHRAIQQLADLVEDPEVKKIAHNSKFDHHMLSKVPVARGDLTAGTCAVTKMVPRGWYLDTEIMAFQVDENMIQSNLDECVRVFVPEMAGYADAFNGTIDKSRMIDVPPDDVYDENQKIVQYGMRNYAGGDTDACFRLAQVLRERLQQDPRQWKVMMKVQMAAEAMFRQVTEPTGVLIDKERLTEFGGEIDEYTRDMYKALIRQVPAALRRKHMGLATGKGNHGTKAQTDALAKALSFTRDEFTRDVLFGKDGFKLTPQVWTPSTAKLPQHQRVPSCSTKDHLPYFLVDEKLPTFTVGEDTGNFVYHLTDFMKAKKLSSTYIGKEAEGNGFWQYLSSNSTIHPSFTLTGTNTGRTASRNPNGQNFPKRGRYAKAYQSIFKPRPGKVFGASDLSQIELRLIAWAANEATMLDVYRSGGDIHASTAAIALGMSPEEFAEWKNDAVLLRDVLDLPGARQLYEQTKPDKKATVTLKALHALQRFRAKAVNFGFCYGAQAETFRTYAKTNYGADFTEAEAILIRERYFEKYALEQWHAAMREVAHRAGMVRSLHGAARHLPSIKSADRSTVSSTERQAINAPIQRFGSDLCLIGATRFQAHVHPDIARVVLTVHDQVVLEIEQGYEDYILPVLQWSMQNPPIKRWFGITAPLPFGSDAEVSATSLGAMEEREDLVATKPSWWVEEDSDAILKSFIDGNPEYVFTPGMSIEQAQQALVRVGA